MITRDLLIVEEFLMKLSECFYTFGNLEIIQMKQCEWENIAFLSERSFIFKGSQAEKVGHQWYVFMWYNSSGNHILHIDVCDLWSLNELFISPLHTYLFKCNLLKYALQLVEFTFKLDCLMDKLDELRIFNHKFKLLSISVYNVTCK